MSIINKHMVREIEDKIKKGIPITLIPINGDIEIEEGISFLTTEETDEFLGSLGPINIATYLDQLIWQYCDGSVKTFAKKLGYHPNTISRLKYSNKYISIKLFNNIIKIFNIDEKNKKYWSKNLLGI